jgi:hypothetical protein
MATGRVPTTANSPLTAKGDLFGYSTTQARVPVGSDGETLVADSSTTTGLRWQGNFAAGKNAIINGDFSINQRSFSSTTTDGTFGFDRWALVTSGGTCTYSTQSFTAGTAPVAGYEGTNFARLLTSGQTSAYSILVQRIENARSFANQTVTVSFWAKAASGTPQVAINFYRNYGSGGSPSAAEYTNTASKVTLSTSWARYTATLTVPSVSGKTFGTTANTSFLALYLFVSDNITGGSSSLGVQNNTFDFWGVQVEAGSVATPFQTATGTLQGELAACQRYYYRISSTASNVYAYMTPSGSASSSTSAAAVAVFPVQMRVVPTSLDYANLALTDNAANFAVSALVLNTATGSPLGMTLTVTSTGLTTSRFYLLVANNSSSAYLGLSAEL